MTEDVIDFGPPARPDRPQPRSRPAWLTGGITVPLATLGAALAAASSVGPWQSVRIPEEGFPGQRFSGPVTSAGALGNTYLMALVLLITVTVLAVFSADAKVRGLARLAGLALAGCALVLLGATANLLSRTTEGANFAFYPEDVMEQVIFKLEWGLYAAFAGVLAIGLALAFSRPAVAGSVEQEQRSEQDFSDDDDMELTVTVHPISR